MRLLWVKVGGLWPLDAGGRLRSFHIVRELSRRHALTVLTTHGPQDDPQAAAAQLPACRVVSFPHAAPKQGSPQFARALARSWLSPLPVDLWRWQVAGLREAAARQIQEGHTELCVADFLSAVPNLPPGRIPVVLFQHNVEHVIWQRLAGLERKPWRRALLEIEWRKLRRFEAGACAAAAHTVAVSEADRSALAALAPRSQISAIPTGVDTAYFHANGARPRPARLVFSGSMDWYPNEDAMVHFIDAILPLVRRQVPEVEVTVVGRRPGAGFRARAEAAGVKVTGTVEDVRPFVDEAAVYVVPLRIGGGTRLKIFEALSMGKAVVSTGIGAEGLPLVEGRHFLRADDPASFAGAVVSLLADPARRNALGLAGRRLVEERFSWSQVAQEFESRLMEVIPCA
jgi:glycosyltransferase involved in cell wall biosynthesis